MSKDELDISGALTWNDGLPHLEWNDIVACVESAHEPEAPRDLWDTALRQWLRELGTALGGEYEVAESAHFFVLTAEPDAVGRPVLGTAERCRAALLSGLAPVASFDGQGRDVLLVIKTRDDYYRYIAHYYPEGTFGQSAGVHIRHGLSHIASYGTELWSVESTVAHELTHASLCHLNLPQWLEEGLAQVFERDVTGWSEFVVDADMAARHKRFWSRAGLNPFWYGQGFSHRGLAQRLSYEFAEILVRLLLQERGRRRGRNAREGLLAFLGEADASDGGEAACLEHMGFALGDLAAHFLGPGSWAPEAV